MSDILSAHQLVKDFDELKTSVSVLKGVELHIKAEERVAIMGPSGSGKSTLLHLLGGLERPTSGEVRLMGASFDTSSEKERCALRNQHLGFIYQFHHLLPEFSAYENIAMPLWLAGETDKAIHSKIDDMLHAIGLSKRAAHKPAELSGGERQRVAIARALIHEPSCVLADEPTGNLDRATAQHVFELMLALNKKKKTALVIVTHDESIAKQLDKCYFLRDGVLTQ